MTVHLVGAGPGDPGLLTRRGAELLAEADVVLHDHLVGAGILELARPEALLVDVGKRAGDAGSPSQSSLNELLVACAGSFEVVVRLKGGDPFVFGRGA
ncbi:MAG TPA: SAM-dependent methyltransferase, partial [Acidimicrobiales bacterium]|nr:SAM-dependent methyltransferase [Acidimicrobiales bacterium]